MKQFLICLIATAIGATPGVLLAFYLESPQFLGIALIGALIGFGLAMSSIVYKTTFWDSLRRIFKGLAHSFLSHNLGRLGAKLVPLDGETPTDQLIRWAPPSIQTAEDLKRARDVGGMIGGGGIGAIALAVALFHLPGDQAGLAEQIKMPIVYCLAGAIVGYVHGAAISIVRIPGRHRRNVLIGAVAGVVIGIGLGIATSENAKDPLIYWIGVMLLLTTLGVGGGTFASENAPSSNAPTRRNW